jgi:hypothetical protein
MIGINEEVSARGRVNDYYGHTDKRGTKYYAPYGAPVESKNIEEGQVRVVGNIGADYRVSKLAKLGAHVSLEKGVDGNYSEVKGSVVLDVKIGVGRGLEAAGRELRRTKERLELRAQEEIEDKKDDVRSALKGKKKEMGKKNKELMRKIEKTKKRSSLKR